MSNERTTDVSNIRDEDTLRRMWQETEDFARKKEIRSHMYKLREARLRDFYTSGEVGTDVENVHHHHTTTTTSKTSGLRENNMMKDRNVPTHADSLADHSFMSLKTKEIRDSESPNRDLQFKVTGSSGNKCDDGWTIQTTNERSDDGKTHRTTRVATTSGTKELNDGIVENFAAKNEQQASVYRDGDENNFKKSVSASSKSVIEQQAVGGDENSKFKSSATKSSTSSRVVTEEKSSNYEPIRDNASGAVVQKERYVTDRTQNDAVNRPHYVDANTKVYTETKTLPDGSTVTTTRYETVGGTSSVEKYSTSHEEKSSSTRQSAQHHSTQEIRSSNEERRTRNLRDQHVSTDNVDRTIEYVQPRTVSTTTSDVRNIQNARRDSNIQHETKETRVTNQRTSEDVHKGTNKQTVTRMVEEEAITRPSIHETRITDKSDFVTNQRFRDNKDSNYDVVVRSTKEVPANEVHTTVTTTTTVYNDGKVQDRKTTSDNFINVEKEHFKDTQVTQHQDQRTKELIAAIPRDSFPHSPRDSGIQTPRDSGTQKPRDSVPQTPRDSVPQTPRDLVPHTPGDSIPQTTSRDSVHTSRDTMTHVTRESVVNATKGSTVDVHKDVRYTSETPRGIEPNTPRESVPQTPRDLVPETPRDCFPQTRKQPEYPPSRDSTTSITHIRRETTEDVTERPKEPVTRTVTTTQDTTRTQKVPNDVEIVDVRPTAPKEDREPYVQPDRRQPFKPPKSEMDTKSQPTDGQYDTTYRTDYTSKRISVDVSPTHDAFARSLRAVTPERDVKSPRGSTRSLRTSSSSLRGSTSPEKYPNGRPTPDRYRPSPDRHHQSSPDRYRSPSEAKPASPVVSRSSSPRKSPTKTSPTSRRPEDHQRPVNGVCAPREKSPQKKPSSTPINGTTRKSPGRIVEYSTDTITKRPKPTTTTTYSTDTITKTRRTKEDVTKFGNRQPRSRSSSPTSTASDIEYVKNRDELITNLDVEESDRTTTKSTSQRTTVTTHDTKKSTDRVPPSAARISPKKESSPVKDKTTRTDIDENKSTFKRTDTYEERCRQILGIPDKKTVEKNITDILINDRKTTRKNKPESPTKEVPRGKPTSQLPEKPKTTTTTTTFIDKERRDTDITIEKFESPQKQRQPDKIHPSVSEFPSQVRKSPEREPLGPYPEKRRPDKYQSPVAEFPSQVRRSPEKEPLEPYPEKGKPDKYKSTVCEFPSQVRKSPEKEPLEPYPEKRRPDKYQSSVAEFPSQVRRSPEKEPLEPYPEKGKPDKYKSTVCEFPSQVRKSPEKEPLEPYPEKRRPDKYQSSVAEFPSQVRRSPEKERLEPYPEKGKPDKYKSTVCEFPSQVRKSPEKEPLEPYPEKRRPDKYQSPVSEFPSQVRRSPEKEPLEPYPEKEKPDKYKSTVCEFPSQVRKSPEKEPLEPYPEKRRPDKYQSPVSEFPSQVRRSPEKELLEHYPQTEKPGKYRSTINEYPNQVRRSPERELFEPYPDKRRPTDNKPLRPDEVDEFQVRKDTVYYQTAVPVNEPMVTKKFIDTLCRDDELDRRTKVTKERLSPIRGIPDVDDESRRPNKTVKKDMPERKPLAKPKDTRTFITKERIDTNAKQPTQKIPQDLKRIPAKKTTDTTTTKKISLTDIDKMSNQRVDNRTHVRTYRIDTTTINKQDKVPAKKKPETFVTRKPLDKRPPSSSPEKKMRPINDTKPAAKKPAQSPDRFTKLIENDKNIYNTRKTTTTMTITKKPITPAPKRHVVSTIINVSPKKRPDLTKPDHAKPDAPKSKQPSRPPTVVTTKTTTIYAPRTVPTKPSKLERPTGPKPSTVHTTVKTTRVTQVRPATEKPKPQHTNGYKSDETVSSETSDDEEIRIDEETTTTSTRTQKKTHHVPEEAKPRPEKKCVTTKSIVINNNVADEREIIVDLQRSKSSREPTPDRICPRPISSDDEDLMDRPSRYPDRITEPDDGSLRRRPKKLTDVPIVEDETYEETQRITEIDRNVDVDVSLASVTDKVTKFSTVTQRPTKPEGPAPRIPRPRLTVDDDDLIEDECLLSVSDKVNRFITTAEKLTSQPDRPRSPRPIVKETDLDEEDDETDRRVNVSEKVSKFTTQSKTEPKKKVPLTRPDMKDVDDSLRSDVCLLSVSDKVSKFIETAEKLSVSDTKKTTVNLEKLDVRRTSPDRKPSDLTNDRPTYKKDVPTDYTSRTSPARDSPREYPRSSPTKEIRRSPSKDSPTRSVQSPARSSPTDSPKRHRSPEKTVTECVTVEDEEHAYTRRPKSKSPERASSKRPLDTGDSTPKTSRRTSQDEKSVLSTTSRLRSTESIKRARALFENITKTNETTRQKDIISRPSVFDGRKPRPEDAKLIDIGVKRTEETTTRKREQSPRKPDESRTKPDTRRYGETARTKLEFSSDEETTVSTRRKSTHSRKSIDEDIVFHKFVPGTDDVPSSGRRPRSRDVSPDDATPGYMRPLDRSLRPNSPHLENLNKLNETTTTVRTSNAHLDEQTDTRVTKFGITLRRTDSGRNTLITTTTDRKSSNILEQLDREIEEIYDLELLELLLERVTDYEFRRRIRSQIRIVKRLITENRLEIVIRETETARARKSPSKTIPSKTEYQGKYTRKPSSPTRTVDNKLYQHTDFIDDRSQTVKSKTTEYQASYSTSSRRTSSTVETRSSPERKYVPERGTSPSSKKSPERRFSPDRKINPDRQFSPERKPNQQRKSGPDTRTSPDRKAKAPSPERKSSMRKESPERRTSIKRVTISPERVITESESKKNIFKTDLKRVQQVTTRKTSTSDDKPEWVTKRNLRKVTDNNDAVPFKKTTTTTTTRRETVRSSSPSSKTKTDVITSSYGAGPMDENGTPLFGLKALRAQKKAEDTATTKTKVQGTIIRSEYYSENGNDPTGEVSVTKYSTDPHDFSDDDDQEVRQKGLRSVTTTQKFGYKGTPSLKTITDRRKQGAYDEDNEFTTNRTTTKVTRRGSVKEMSQKFIENAVETLKSEKQTTYPKAGLILRTSSFKDTKDRHSRGSSSSASRECSPEQDVRRSTSTVKETFLSNRSRVTGAQDVITRMRNAEDEEDGLTRDDVEAKNLLNKFIGSQVILHGAESRSARPSTTATTTTTTSAARTSIFASATTTISSTGKRVTKVTTTITEGGKQRKIVRTFEHPLTFEQLETVDEEETLKLLLEQSTEYEERRHIRSRLRQVMADQEACSEDLCRDNECETDGRIHGESLLLPLLQGLLDAPENSEQTPDSGTESGEDLRGGLIVEVQSALDKLSASLRNESTEISSEKRNSLLQLVSRLQAGLSSQTTTNNIANPERRNSGSSGSGQGRFAKRRQRQNRHTVGVTSEELEDARRLMEEIAFRENAAKITPLTKQNSEGAVIGKRAFAPAIYSPKSPVTNAIAKPFSNATTSTVETPTDASECTDPFAKQSVSSDENKKHVNCDKKTNSESKRSLSESNSLDVKQIADVKIAHHVAPKPNKNQQEEEASNHTTPTLSPLFHAASPTSTAQSPKNTIVVPSESETDEDPSTLKAPPLVRQHVEQNSEMSNEKPIVASLASENPTYKSHLLEDHGKYGGRFNSDKKLKMKRANTIDIPKPVHIYDDDDDYNDDDNDEIDIDRNARRSNYYALRGPIRVTTPKNGNDGPPTFEAKTESDRKFMAFINKHNDKNASKGTLWGQARSANQGTNWTRKFGNIRTAFERAAEGDEKPTPTSKARSFWQTADDTVTAGRASTVIGPTISRQNARNLQQMFEEKQRQKTSQIKAPSWPEHEQQNVVTGSLKVDTKKNYRVVSQNVPAVNNFSHAPLSAFKPIARNPPRVADDTLSVPTNVVKAAISDQRNPEQPLYLYSPKPLAAASPSDSCDSAPLSPKPVPKLSKLHNHAESRVMSIATAKFENPAPPHDCLVKPKKSKSEKVAIPPAIQRPHENGTEKVTATYITRTVGSNTVRKLSDQYDNLGNLSQPQISPTNPKYVPSYANPITKQTYSNKPIGGGQSAFAPYSPPQDSYQHNHHQQHAQQQHHYTPHQPSHNFSVPSQTPQYQPPQYQRPQYQPQQYQPPQYSSVPHASLMKDDSWQRKATYPEPSVTYSVYPDRPLPQQQQQQQQQYYNQQPQHYHQQQQQQPNYNQQQYAPQHYYQQPPQPQHNYPPHYEPSYNPQRYEAPPHNQYQTYDRPSSNAHNKQPQSYNYYQPQQIVEQPVANKPIAVYNNVYKRPETSQLQRNAPTSTSLKLQKAEQHRPELQKQLSNDNVKEYNAINSRVMTGPVGQQAVTVAQNKPKSRGEHDMDAAFSLKNSLKSIAQNSNEMAVKQQQQQQRKKTTSSVQNHQQQKMPDFRLNDKPVNLQSLEINERGESIVTSTFRIPVVKTSPSSMAPSTASSQVASSKGTSDVPKRTSPSALSKCESWHQIVHDQVANKPSPRASPNSRTVVRSKSSHTLHLPKQFEAGMSKDEMQSKKKSIAAYFGATSAATTKQSSSKSKSSINRIKTSQKLSTATSSATAVVAASGVSSSTGNNNTVTKRSNTESSVTTTTQVSSRMSSQQVAKKPISPFAKFRQMDKQNSLNTPPSTPKTPTGSGPLFKFTDPNLKSSANTIKERLLQWCQMKTKEYENIKLENFSSSWADGLAFCALIHHFLPDAFDYHSLSPKNRKYNFTLAFQVADEKAGIAPLLDVSDMIETRKPDWKCVFTYVQTIYARFRNED